MADQWVQQMGDTTDQMKEVLVGFAPILMTDKGRRQNEEEENPRRQKQPRGAQQEQTMPPWQDGSDRDQTVQTLCSLVLKLDREMNQLRRQDTWIIFMNQDQRGILMKLLAETQKWHTAGQTSPPTQPLRFVLVQTLFAELRDRLQKVHRLQEADPLKKTLQDKQVLSPDGVWAYLRWDPQKMCLTKTDKPGLTMKAALGLMDELNENLTEPTDIVRFNSLRRKEDMKDIPWMLTVSLRSDHLWRALTTLNYNSLWTLLGASAKPHTLQQSKQADFLSHQVYPENVRQSQAKGKGKHKAKR